MAKYSEPKDYMLGREAYKTYFGDVTNHVQFSDLSHEYQMRWVTVARAVLNGTKNLRKIPTSVASTTVQSDAELLASAPRLPSGRIAYKSLDPDKAKQVRVASIREAKRRYNERSKDD